MIATYSHARCAGKASMLLLPLPSPSPTTHDAIRMPAMTATIAQNSVVLSERFVSLVSRISIPPRVPPPVRSSAPRVAIDPSLSIVGCVLLHHRVARQTHAYGGRLRSHSGTLAQPSASQPGPD